VSGFRGGGTLRAVGSFGVAALAMAAFPAPAAAACSIGRMAELPVTMEGMGPMVDARINGTPVRFIADSGAFWSVISPANAQMLHLPPQPGFRDFSLQGINGSAAAGVVSVKTFTLAGIDIPRLQFVVAGSETGGVGVLGQNVLGIGDVEYDLPHGAIRLMKSKDCGRANLAYWAKGRSSSMVAISPRSPQQPHTIGTVYVNDKPVRATFDTGASTSILSLAAAARAGIRPGDPGITDGGMAWGFGRRLVRTWIAPIGRFAVGDGEQIQNARIRIGQIGDVADMLIGADFFIAHRAYVDNANHRLFLTYEGGPIFNLKVRDEGLDGRRADTAADGGGPPVTADAYARNGAIALSRNDPDAAVAAFSKAVDAAPHEARYLYQRYAAYWRLKKPVLARHDLDAAISLSPDYVDALLARAALSIGDGHRDAALADLTAADRATAPAAMERLALGSLFTDAGQPQLAVGALDLWIRAHPDDVRRPEALNGRCWARALGGQDLDAALRDCDAALRARPGTPSFLDSRGLVRLRRGEFGKAIADYDDALAKEPDMAWSRYGRGIAKLRLADASGRKDIDAAIALDPHIAAEAASSGIQP
jgi:tetratricopeptide (TPR) repeat protein/predicted aspartyl protease